MHSDIMLIMGMFLKENSTTLKTEGLRHHCGFFCDRQYSKSCVLKHSICN